ncbi:MAG: metallophosphoesterase, partial [Clostridia bacterium]
MSDIHQNGDTNSIAVKKFKSALKQLKIGYDLDLILVAGDMTDSGSENQIKQFKSTLQSVYTEAIPLVYSLGNHDGQGGLTAERFQKIYGDAYFNADIDKNSIKSGNRHAVVNGYHFITIETESYYNSNGDCSYSQETKVWLKDQLKLASEQSPEKPIFVATHAMIYNTAYGSTLPGTGTNWYTTELTEILNEYPQAVTFGGHVHHPLNDERSIMQTKFTSLGCGSVSYMAIESGYIQTGATTVPNDCQKYSQGIVAQVDEKNNVRFTRMDFYNNSTIKEAWVISSPSAKNHLKEYTPERADKNEAPSFGVNPEFAFTSDISGYKCNLNVSFPAASDDDMVHHYEIEVSIDGKVFKTYKLLSGFYLVPTTDKMAKKLVANLEALPTAKKAEINICAIDSWGAKSTPITYSLTTPGNPEISVPDADTKSKIYASIEFSADGKYTDKFSKLLLTNVGADISVQKFT